ncbi:alpha/beta hydrolase fold [Nesidiocoris tenuis]|uniref:Alpha/beta hydrolase fold n=1 Tax=Nesidiocoris tenuis TaxID=355587 RepID=A0ABN7B206_9HEMI|nr:alpha/beta hydrolase fold [Nesidiocoris tenuis]
MADVSAFFKCFVSPSLYYSFASQIERYQPNNVESLGINIISTINIVKALGTYTTPVLLWLLYRRGYMSAEGALALTKVGLSIGIIMGTSYCIRSYGRASNPKYREFLKKLESIKDGNGDRNAIKEIKRYDFEFSAWPVEFEFDKKFAVLKADSQVSWRSLVSSLVGSPCSIVGFLVMHTFGIRLLYPGSMSVLNFILRQAQMEGRINLIEKLGGERFKLKTVDRNYIDSMFVDRRKTNSSKGRILVVCSEGNAAFYENGIMSTAIDAGYSVLGWNHPGFGSSTGMPYLEQEQNAMETVMQFAIKDLKFAPDHIILFGWSIGGYSTAWAASLYPDVKEVIVDATFDDVLPLAQNQMPDFLDSIVRTTIRCYADLNVTRLLAEYPGPIRMVRRSEDEIISIEPGNVSTNRGNFLLLKLLKKRYPTLFNPVSEGALQNWLDTKGPQREAFLRPLDIKASECEALISSYTSQYGPKFPFGSLGNDLDEEGKAKLLLYLAGVYMIDYNSTHCTPLPTRVFQSLIV